MLGLFAASVGGCSNPSTLASKSVSNIVAKPPAQPTQPPLPQGILAEAQGKQGMIRVEERDGLRLLTIDGVVQAAMPVSMLSMPSRGDNLVALLHAVRPSAKKVLVIGLGSGKTAAELASLGWDVDVVEIEPVVIDFARRYFGYKGNAIPEDGITYLTRTDKRYDIVVVDAFAGKDPPEQLFERATFDRIGAERDSPTVVAVRLLGAPFEPRMAQLVRRFRNSVWFTHLYASGVAQEEQNLYLVGSNQAINLVVPEGKSLALWPVPDDAIEVPDAVADAKPSASRHLAMVGYLIRAREDGALCVDLPHYEMGAQRYRLTGPLVAELEQLIAKNQDPPTQGDIGSDGDTSKTLREVLGGGGMKRSDVRFSEVVIAVEGDARIVASIHPDAAARVPESLRQGALLYSGLPYGGALYDLSLTKVLWKLDAATWNALQKKLQPIVKHGVKAIDTDDFASATQSLANYGAVFDANLSALNHRVLARTEVDKIAKALDAEQKTLPAKPSSLDRAVLCDRVQTRQSLSYERLAKDAATVDDALLKCAERNYHKAIAEKHPRRNLAAARLMYLLEEQTYRLDPPQAKPLELRIVRLRAQFPDVEPEREPP